MVGIVEYAVLLILHFLLQAFPPLLTHHVFLSVLDINSVGGGLGFNALEVYPCGIVRIFHVQRHKMKIVQYCKMLRKLAISYDSGPIILLPFYLFTLFPFLPFHREYIEFAVDVVVEHPLVDYDMRVERLDGDGMFAHRKICEDGAERLTT